MKRILGFFLMLLAAVLVCMGVAGCGMFGDVPPHEHFSAHYRVDERNHWKECFCGKTFGSQAHEFDADGVCTVCDYHPNGDDTEGLEYEIKHGTCAVTGAGKARGAREIVVPAYHDGRAVTEIRQGAFSDNSSLVRISIPSTVEGIGEYESEGEYKYLGAFRNCPALEEIAVDEKNSRYCSDGNCLMDRSAKLVLHGCKNSVIPADAKGIESFAFYGCSSLETLILPAGISSIGCEAFAGCPNLKSVAFEEGATSCLFRRDAFKNCGALKKVDLPAEGSAGFGGLFAGCPIEEAAVPGNLLETLPRGVERLTVKGGPVGRFEFFGTLKRVEVLGVSEIESYAFRNCSELKQIVLSDGVTSIGREAFAGTAYSMDAGNWEGDALYVSNHLISVKQSASGSFTVRAQTKTIADEAFLECTSITQLFLPADMRYIGEQSLFSDERHPDQAESLLESITVGEGSPYLSRDGILYLEDGTILCIPQKLKGSVTLPDSVTGIADAAFAGRGIEHITLPAGLMTLSESAFSCCQALRSVQFAEGSLLNKIGDFCFASCESLESIEIPASVHTIGEGAFENCSSLVSAAVGEESNLSVLGDRAFAHCTSLKEFFLPKNVRTLAGSTFAGCDAMTGLTVSKENKYYADRDGIVYGHAFSEIFFVPKGITGTIKIPSDVTELGNFFQDRSALEEVIFEEDSKLTQIGYRAFKNCKALRSICLPGGVTQIGAGAFSHCESLEAVDFPDGLTQIGTEAFEYCGSLEAVDFPDGLTQIGSWAFEYCEALEKIHFSDALTEIGSGAFNGCSALKRVSLPSQVQLGSFVFGNGIEWVEVAPENPYYSSREGILYNKEETDFVILPLSIRSITIPARMTADPGHGLLDRKGCILEYCENLERIDVEAGNPDYISRDGILYCTKDGMELVCVPAMIFGEIEIPAGMTEIPDEAFSMRGITSVSFEEGSKLKRIGQKAFCECGYLTKFFVPAEVTEIGYDAFYNCIKLIEVWNASELDIRVRKMEHGMIAFYAAAVYETDAESCQVETDDGFVFFENEEESVLFEYRGNATALELPELSPKGRSYDIGPFAFSDFEEIVSIRLAEGVREIGNCAFADCTALESIVIPESVTSIGEDVFFGCTALRSAVLPAGTKSIPAGLFYGCSSLNEFTFPEGVTLIDDEAFCGCSSLILTALPESVTAIGRETFCGCSSIVLTALPEGVTFIGEGAFMECSSLNLTELPAGLTWLERETFRGCSSLKFMELPEGLASIGGMAFSGCIALERIFVPASVSSMGFCAFQGCDVLKRVDIAELAPWFKIEFEDSYANPLFIAGHLYVNGTEMTEIEIPAGVTKLKPYVFNRFTALTRLVLPAGITSIGSRTFAVCTSLREVVLPAGITSIGNNAFAVCTSLREVVLPAGVTLVGDSAFSNCTALERIVLPESVTSIGEWAFADCSALERIEYCGNVAAWQAIDRTNGWDLGADGYTIFCTDGKIDQNGNVTMNGTKMFFAKERKRDDETV